MKIIDAHMHLTTDCLTLEEKKFTLLDQMKKNGVSKGIVISDSELVSSIGSMTECAQLFADCEEISVVGGISPLINYDRQLEVMEDYIINKMLVGIKIYCGHEPVYLNDDVLKPVFSIAERYNTPVLFHSGWDNAQYSHAQIIKLTAQANPAVRLVCCHCCYPELSECFSELSAYKNVLFDISSIADGGDSSIPVLEKAIHAMPERFVFGSDFGCCSQSEHISFLSRIDLSDDARELVFYKNAERIYGI